MQTPVEDAKHANGQDKFQTTQELNVSSDHSLNAQIALPADLLMDIHASHAQLVKFRTQQTCQNVLTEHVVDSTKSNFHMITNPAVDVKTANGQPSCQINSGPLVLKDQRLIVDVEKDNLQMDTLANNAQLEPSRAQLTPRLVWDHNVLENTKSNSRLMRSPVEHVILVNGHNSCQTLQELNACLDH